MLGIMVDSWIGFQCKREGYFIIDEVGGKGRAGGRCGQQRGGFLGAMLASQGVKVSADVGVSKTNVADSEAGDDDFVTTEGFENFWKSPTIDVAQTQDANRIL